MWAHASVQVPSLFWGRSYNQMIKRHLLLHYDANSSTTTSRGTRVPSVANTRITRVDS